MTDRRQDAGRSEAARVFDGHRGLLISMAYRVLGSVTDAEDAVQEAWLRWSGVDHSKIADLRAWITVTSRYESLTGEPYETKWTINLLLLPGGLYAKDIGATG